MTYPMQLCERLKGKSCSEVVAELERHLLELKALRRRGVVFYACGDAQPEPLADLIARTENFLEWVSFPEFYVLSEDGKWAYALGGD